MMKTSKKVSNIPPMDDQDLAKFWEKHEPEDFEGWGKGDLDFRRPPKKVVLLRLDPRDFRMIDKESKRSGIDRAQLVRSWVKEKIEQLENRAKG